MYADNPIKLFVSHAWQEHTEYLRVFEYLESTTNFFYVNLSNPTLPPGARDRESQKEELRNQIKGAEVVVILASLYANHRDWLDFEMHAAKAFDKPIVALEHFGTAQSVAKEIADHADEVIEWNERSLVDALRRQARHEDTTRWEVIDFP